MSEEQSPLSDIEKFLQAVWPDLAGRWLLLWGAPSKRSEWCNAINAISLTAIDLWAKKENVYMGCGLRGQNLGPTLRGEKSEVVAIPGVWLDIDYGAEHKKPNLPPAEESAQELIEAMGLPPSAVVHSGRGLQAWWLFKELWEFANDEDRQKAETLTMGWCSTLRARAQAKGWDADQVGDITRVMRLPGTFNRKGVPRPTKLLSLTEARYDPSELEPFLIQEAMKERNVASIKWTFELNPKAEPPADKFFLLQEIDQRFKLAWLHARSDMPDQSASSYDLALATRAFGAEWSAQEVVNLLIAHRRKHREDLKLRADYYERTLNVAINGKDEEARKTHVEQAKEGKPLPESVTKDPAEMLAIVSEMLGVTISKFVRFRGATNSYQLDVKGHVINVEGVEDLDSATRFRRLILDHTDVRILPMKPADWQSLIEKLFMAVENVDVVSSTNKGAFENWLAIYLSADGISPEDKWEEAAYQSKPFYRGTEICVIGEGFRHFLVSRMHERITSQDLGAMLTKLGWVYERIWFKTKKKVRTSRGMWRISAHALH